MFSGSLSKAGRGNPSLWQRTRQQALDLDRSVAEHPDGALVYVRYALWSALLIGMLTRLSPLIDPDGRLFWQFMTEDGYLMQTVARNMALGLGMSTAEGTIPTNGVQPLITYLFAALHWLAGGDRYASIALVTILSAAIAAGSAYVFYRLAQELLAGLTLRDDAALAIAAAWFVGPLTIRHSMNGLETGLYVLMMLASLLYFLRTFSGNAARIRLREAAVLGGLLGLTFLSRNDAAFFIAALLGAHLIMGSRHPAELKKRFVECLAAGSISVLVGLPWLLNNYLLFGSVVPISGISQSHSAQLGENFAYIASNLVECALPFLPIPRSIETNVVVMLASAAVLAGIFAAYWQLWGRESEARRRAFVTTLIFGAMISLYYGVFFGAAHFIPRYLSILSPLMWFTTAVVGIVVLMSMSGTVQRLKMALSGGAIALAAFAFALMVFFYAKGTEHMHKQQVGWIAANAKPAEWVGAVQTGTIGYFHDRTLNLDGKVNPDALRHLLDDGHVLDYVTTTKVKYIVDWAGLVDWKSDPAAANFNRHFDLIVHDVAKNLSVYRRSAPADQNSENQHHAN